MCTAYGRSDTVIFPVCLAKSTVIYDLGGKYDVFNCKLTHGEWDSDAAYIKILGDGKILYIATWIKDTQPRDININVQGV